MHAPDGLHDGAEVGKGDVALALGVVELECEVQQLRRVRLPL